MRVLGAPGAFWDAPDAAAEASRCALDGAFIDDEALALVAQRACELDVAIDVLLETVFEVFDCFHLSLNPAPGKTEGLLQHRGPHATACREARRCADGRLRLRVPRRDVSIDSVES